MVLAEHLGNQVSEATYELMGKARELATAPRRTDRGSPSRTERAGCPAQRRDIVVSVQDAVLDEYLPEAYERVLSQVLAARSPRLLLMSHATIGLDLGAALSVRWDCAAGQLCECSGDRGGSCDSHATRYRRQSACRCRAAW